jgi:hypothetical protein
MKDTLYIHTNKYDAQVSKTNFLRCVEYQYKYLMYKNSVEIKNLYSIYCYKDGIVRFSLWQDNYDRKIVVVEQYLPDFSAVINTILENSFLKQKVS